MTSVVTMRNRGRNILRFVLTRSAGDMDSLLDLLRRERHIAPPQAEKEGRTQGSITCGIELFNSANVLTRPKFITSVAFPVAETNPATTASVSSERLCRFRRVERACGTARP